MRLLERRLELPKAFEVPPYYINGKNGNTQLLGTFLSWGANAHFLTNGGGAVHLLNSSFGGNVYPLRSIDDLARGVPVGFTIPETSAAYAALAYNMGSGRIAVCDVTTGGALDLANPAITDAWFHSRPVIVTAALSSSKAGKLAPLQDTGENGFNTIAYMKARYGDGCQVIRRIDDVGEVLYNARDRLTDSKPVVILYHPDILKQHLEWIDVPWKESARSIDGVALSEFLGSFAKETNGKKVVLFVGEEAVRYENAPPLITALARILKAPTIYTQVGASAVSHENEYAAGHIMLGYNDFAKKLWDGLTREDTVICVGFDPFEYCTNQDSVKANAVVITNYSAPYGSADGTFAHRVEGKYRHIKGDFELVLAKIIDELKGQTLQRPEVKIPENLNEGKYQAHRGFTNMERFYRSLADMVEPGTIILGDVSTGYKDPQRAIQRPVYGVQRLEVHQGSLMGQGFGQALGLRLARPDKHIHLLTGDGCFEYFEGSLARIKDLGLMVWVLDNGTHALVSWGLSKIKPDLPADMRLTDVPRKNYARIARGHFWEGRNLRPNLGNLDKIMTRANSAQRQSMLVRVKMHPDDDYGQNPRLSGLADQGRSAGH